MFGFLTSEAGRKFTLRMRSKVSTLSQVLQQEGCECAQTRNNRAKESSHASPGEYLVTIVDGYEPLQLAHELLHGEMA